MITLDDFHVHTDADANVLPVWGVADEHTGWEGTWVWLKFHRDGKYHNAVLPLGIWNPNDPSQRVYRNEGDLRDTFDEILAFEKEHNVRLRIQVGDFDDDEWEAKAAGSTLAAYIDIVRRRARG